MDTTQQPRTEEIEAQLRALTSRDLQLWSIAFLVMIVLSLSVVAIAVPRVSDAAVRVEIRYIPQLALGLISLVLLLNLYIASKKKEVNRTRVALVRELVLNEQLEQFSLVDPETQLFNRSYVPHLLATEMKRCNRFGDPFSLLVADVVWSHVPLEREKDFLVQAAAVLRATFRGSDILVRLGAARFLTLMPMTNREQARIALRRLTKAVEDWNLSTADAEMLLNWVIGPCSPGEEAGAVLRKAEDELDQLRATSAPRNGRGEVLCPPVAEVGTSSEPRSASAAASRSA